LLFIELPNNIVFEKWSTTIRASFVICEPMIEARAVKIMFAFSVHKLVLLVRQSDRGSFWILGKFEQGI